MWVCDHCQVNEVPARVERAERAARARVPGAQGARRARARCAAPLVWGLRGVRGAGGCCTSAARCGGGGVRAGADSSAAPRLTQPPPLRPRHPRQLSFPAPPHCQHKPRAAVRHDIFHAAIRLDLQQEVAVVQGYACLVKGRVRLVMLSRYHRCTPRQSSGFGCLVPRTKSSLEEWPCNIYE